MSSFSASAQLSYLSAEKKVSWSKASERAAQFRVAREKLRLQDGSFAPAGTVLPTGTYKSASGECVRTKQRFLIDGEGVVYAKASATLGAGAFGEVTLAENEGGEFFVIKDFSPDEKTSDVLFEYRIAKNVNVATTHFIYKNKHSVILRYLGRSLPDYLIKNKQMTWIDRLQLAVRIIDALSDLHEGRASSNNQCYFHLDVKPENILIDHEGKIHFVDFGFSLMAGMQMSSYQGTPSYLLKVHDHLRKCDPRLFDAFALLRTFYMPPRYLSLYGMKQRTDFCAETNLFTDKMINEIPELNSLSMKNHEDFQSVVRNCHPKDLLASIKAKLINVQNELPNRAFKYAANTVLTALVLTRNETSDPVKLMAINWLMKKVEGLFSSVRTNLSVNAAVRQLMALIGVAKTVFSHHQKTVSSIFGRLYNTKSYSTFSKKAQDVCAFLNTVGLSTECAEETNYFSHINYPYFALQLRREIVGMQLPRMRG